MTASRLMFSALVALSVLLLSISSVRAQDDVSWTLTLSGQDSNPSNDPTTWRDDFTVWKSLYNNPAVSINMPVESREPGVVTNDGLTEAEWTSKGDTSTAAETSVGNDGTLNVPSNVAQPVGRMGQAVWTTSDGMMYLYGGFSNGVYRSDLWKFNPTTRQYTRMSTSTDGLAPTYGTRKTGAAENTPGSRAYAGAASSGTKLWLVGGYSVVAANPVQYGDVWSFDTATGMWTWMAGSNAVDAAAVLPAVGTADVAGDNAAFGARQDLNAWYTNGKLWIFGGQKGGTNLGDTWSYDPVNDVFAYLLGPAQADTATVPTVLNTAGSPMFRSGAASGTFDTWIVIAGGKATTSDGASTKYTNDVWRLDTSATPEWKWQSGTGGDVLAVDGGASYTPLRTVGTGDMPGRWRAASASDFVTGPDGGAMLYIYGGMGPVNADHSTMIVMKDLWIIQLDLTEAPVQVWVGGQSALDADQSDTEYTTDAQAYGLGVMSGLAFVDKWGGFWYGYGGDEAGLQANDLFYIKTLARTLRLEISGLAGTATIVSTNFDDDGRAWISNSHAIGEVQTFSFMIHDGATDSVQFTLTLTWVAALNTAITGTYTMGSPATPSSHPMNPTTDSSQSYEFTVPHSATPVTVSGTYAATNNGGYAYTYFPDDETATPLTHSFTVSEADTFDSISFYMYSENGYYESVSVSLEMDEPLSNDNTWTAYYTVDGSDYYFYSSDSSIVQNIDQDDAGKQITITFDPATDATVEGPWGTSNSVPAFAGPTTPGPSGCQSVVDFTVTAQDGTVRNSQYQFCVQASEEDGFSAEFEVDGDYETTWYDYESSTQTFSRSVAGKPGTLTITPDDTATLTSTSWDTPANNVYTFTYPLAGHSLPEVSFVITSESEVPTTYTLVIQVDANDDDTWTALMTTPGPGGLIESLSYFWNDENDEQEVNIIREYASETATIAFTLGDGATFVQTGGYDIMATPYVFTLPAANGQVRKTFRVMAEDGVTASNTTLIINVVPSTDHSWEGTLTTATGLDMDVDSSDANVDDEITWHIGRTYASQTATFAFTLAEGATLVTDGFDIKTTSESIALPVAGGTVTKTMRTMAEDGTSATTWTLNFVVTPSSDNSWTALLTTTTGLSQSIDSDDTGSVIQVSTAYSGQEATLTFTLAPGATFGTGTDILASPYTFNLPTAGGADVVKTVKTIAEDTTTEDTFTLTFEDVASSAKSWSAVMSGLGANAGVSETLTSSHACPYYIPSVPYSARGGSAQFVFTLAPGATLDASSEINSLTFPFNFPAAGAGVQYDLVVKAEDESTTTCELFVATMSDDNVEWTAVLTVGSWQSTTYSNSDATITVNIPFAQRDQEAYWTITKAADATFSNAYDIDESPYWFTTPIAGASFTQDMRVIAGNGDDDDTQVFHLITASTPTTVSSSGTNNGGAIDNTNFTVTATVGTYVSPKVSSNDFTSDTITVNVPGSAAGKNATLTFWLQPGAHLTADGVADIISSPWTVMLGNAGTSKLYKITVTSAEEDEHTYWVKVVVATGCLGSECAASTIMSMSLPLAILLFVFGRNAAQQ